MEDWDLYYTLLKEKAKISCGLLKGYGKRSVLNQIVGCSYIDFKNHIEKQFTKGMSWENRKLWHIDHIVPLATAKNIEDIHKLSHFTNLRPMWAKENIRKKDKKIYLI